MDSRKPLNAVQNKLALKVAPRSAEFYFFCTSGLFEAGQQTWLPAIALMIEANSKK